MTAEDIVRALLRSSFLPLIALLSISIFAIPACGGGEGSSDGGDGGTDGAALAPIEAWQEARQLEYLTNACAQQLNPGSISSVISHLYCESKKMIQPVPAGSVPSEAWDRVFDKQWRLEDCSDFDMLMLMNLLYGHEGHPALPAALWKKIEDTIINFKYWFSDPTPVRTVDGAQVVDMMWYWSENHVLLFRTNEFLAGQRFPDRVFTVSGLTGRQHMERAKKEILTWLDERARWGFTEWHSNVYYNWDQKPLLTLVEWSQDPEIAKRAAMVLDLVCLDVALHLHRGTFGATHGRSYIKDQPAAHLEDTFDFSKLFFDDTTVPFQGYDSGGAVLFATARKYALPWVVRTIAKYDLPMVDRERMNLPLDESPPEAYDSPIAPPQYGLEWDDGARLPLFWSMSAFVTWPLLPNTLKLAKRYNLFEGQFESLSFIAGLIDLAQPINRVTEDVYPYYQQFWRVITSPLLKEVHTYTYRTADYMLSSIQDYRPGIRSNQIRAWQATVAEQAMVFTQHPAYLPIPEGQTPPTEWNWQDSDEPGPGYWTGDSSLPRIGQFENVAIIIYAPQYQPKPLGLKDFDYRDETHAYFPHSGFDEVVQSGNWTFGRKGDGYVALYSNRPTFWREGQPEVHKNGGRPFDLVAPGGPDNAWIVELGSASEWGGFEAFKSAVSAAAVTVTAIPDRGADGFMDGYNVTYGSPAQGLVSYGWNGPLVVGGSEIEQRWGWRYDNPFVKVSFDSKRYEVRNGQDRLTLDFDALTRDASPAPLNK
jgi:hypothetical protein